MTDKISRLFTPVGIFKKNTVIPFIIVFLSVLNYELFALDNGSSDNKRGFVLTLKVFPEDVSVYLGERLIEPFKVRNYPEGTPCGEFKDYHIPVAPATVTISSSGYRPEVIRMEPDYFISDGSAIAVESSSRDGDITIETKLEPFGTAMRYAGSSPTGEQPKSVEFIPDVRIVKENGSSGELAVVALLRGRGIEVFNGRTGELVKKINIPEPYGSKLGFVETAYLEGRKEIWVSQMDTKMVHIIDAETLSYSGSVPTGGMWTKVLTASPDETRIYASNWLDENLGVINTSQRKLEKVIPLSGIPRGAAFGRDDDLLFVCIYETGNIEKIRVSEGTSEGIIRTGPGAARHIVYDGTRNLFYVSDMWHGTVYSLDPDSGRVGARLRVGPNLNTIKLSADGKYLFVSSRGRNNPATYLVKGRDFGTVSVVDTGSFRIVDRIYGGNQPTGLGLSADGRTLVFSDFLDHRLEFYDIVYFHE